MIQFRQNIMGDIFFKIFHIAKFILNVLMLWSRNNKKYFLLICSYEMQLFRQTSIYAGLSCTHS